MSESGFDYRNAKLSPLHEAVQEAYWDAIGCIDRISATYPATPPLLAEASTAINTARLVALMAAIDGEATPQGEPTGGIPYGVQPYANRPPWMTGEATPQDSVIQTVPTMFASGMKGLLGPTVAADWSNTVKPHDDPTCYCGRCEAALDEPHPRVAANRVATDSMLGTDFRPFPSDAAIVGEA